ncbi:MAG: lipopolysaccharide kinase InaA family protein [Planctomycetota bacterium]
MSAAPPVPPDRTAAPAPPDLESLAARRRVVLKDEPAARVEVLGDGAEAVVRKTYRNRGLRLLQTFLRHSRARRELANLRAIERAGVPCTPPLAADDRRRLGLVPESTLVTAWVPDTATLKQVLADPTVRAPARRALARALGLLLARLHRAGILWVTPMPRNVLVHGAPAAARLVLCDAPAALRLRGPVPASAAQIDLYDAVASPSRQREWSRSERRRCLLAYCAGDRGRTRALWRRLAVRSRGAHRLRKNLWLVLRAIILRHLRPDDPGPPAR